jgi:hypothetical protein
MSDTGQKVSHLLYTVFVILWKCFQFSMMRILYILALTSLNFSVVLKWTAPPVQRKPLKQRDYEIDLESRLGKTQVCSYLPSLREILFIFFCYFLNMY